ncbi:MAG: endonuclease Q family protein [Syntrophomonadaceae bacterium]|nr:endonuclease Q family protein [Syntrophomonadaceae bacterium]
MREVYGDLHIHIGRSAGRPVKITASKNLDLGSIIFHDAPRKGLDMVGIVDAGTTLVAREIDDMLMAAELTEHPKGGFLASNGIFVIAAAEVESREGIHLIIYLPYMHSIRKFQQFIKSRVSNMTLSTQRVDASVKELLNLSFLLEGIFCPAHAFTPHRGAYGMWTDRLASQLGRDLNQIKVLELGLSADTAMADTIGECRDFTFLSNSDAHSSANVGREYNLFRMARMNFEELRYCLENREGRKVLGNYGMDPLLGKYHRSFCLECQSMASGPTPVLSCKTCGSRKLVLGVYDRIVSIRDFEEAHHPVGRPQYHYRVPLQQLPGVGPKTLDKLVRAFKNEINLIEKAGIIDIQNLAGQEIAAMIYKMRSGRLEISPGGGGYYGKVKKNNCQQ